HGRTVHVGSHPRIDPRFFYPCTGMNVHSTNLQEPVIMSTTQKIVLVTGATAGIGRMTALHLANQGHHVIASGRKPAELAKVKTEAGAAKLDTLLLDVTSNASIEAAVLEVDRLTGGRGLDVLVNNAGFGVLG